jgi:beta-mannosidase
MEYHQRSWRGNSRIIEMFSRYFRMPQSFEGFVYLSQVQQALAIKTAVEHWRRARPVCMGTLYWQLNDNWPVCSWSSIDYGGKWKLLHYVTKRFYAPLLVSAFQTPEGDVQIWAGNDRLAEADATITVEVFDFSGNLLRREAQPAKLVGGSSRKIVSWPVPELALEPTKVWMRLTLESGGESVRNEHFFSEPKKLPLQNPEIATAVEAEASGGFLVQLSCASPAFYVSVQAAGIRGEFDDNCITLLSGEPRALRFKPKEQVTLETFQAALRIACLNALHGHPSFSERA